MVISARVSPVRWILWFLGLATFVLLIPSAKFGMPLWKLPKNEIVSALVLTAAFLISAALPAIAVARGKPLARLHVLALTLALFGVAFFYLLFTRSDASFTVLLALFAIGVALLPLAYGSSGFNRLAPIAAVALGLAAVAATFYGMHRPAPTKKALRSETVVRTAYYNVRQVSYIGQIPKPAVRGGGITYLGDELLLGTGDGSLYLFNWPAGSDKLDMRPLPYRVPANGEQFAADVGLRYAEPEFVFAEDKGATNVEPWRFRVTDVLVREAGDRLQLYAAHHYWHSERRCFAIRLSLLEASRSEFLKGPEGPTWKTLYETQPCLPIEGENRKRGRNPFGGVEAGGRLAFLDERHLLLTTGDHGFSGIETHQAYGQDPNAAYGKIMLVPLDGSPAQIYTSGHRNPQGLLIDPEGTIWSTEHGPQGGDELNRIERGKNYGWPTVTYGTDYSSLVWPFAKVQGSHEGFEKPVFSWLPSIGASNLISIQQNLFPAWRGDLLIGSLVGQSLWRIRLNEGHAIVTERIEVRHRIRDLIELRDGRIALWTDEGTIELVEPARGDEPELAFATLCSGCHTMQVGTAHRIGPSLGNVLGRSIGSAEGYEEYSPALKKLNKDVWSEENLDRFLSSPQTFAPGTSMAFGGVPDRKTRQSIIGHLKKGIGPK